MIRRARIEQNREFADCLLKSSDGGQSDHQWMDVGQDTGFGHLDSINPVNAHFNAPHGDFLIH